jgi:hypothetical protein
MVSAPSFSDDEYRFIIVQIFFAKISATNYHGINVEKN